MSTHKDAPATTPPQDPDRRRFLNSTALAGLAGAGLSACHSEIRT